MNVINKFIMSVPFYLLTILAYANPDVAGTYHCQGYDPYSTPPDFKETITIKKNGEVYNVQMIHDGSTLPYDFGTGFITKELPEAFTFVYWDPKNTNTMGIEVLQIKDDGSLAGIYADHSKDKSGKETCTKTST